MQTFFPIRYRSVVTCSLRPIWGLILTACMGTAALAQSDVPACGSLENGYGPFDYLTQRDKLVVVERFHFTPKVEALISGQTSVSVGSDLDYTLKASPNHHRALMAMARLAAKQKLQQPDGATYAVECYFERALRFRPYDETARVIYATYLFKNRRDKEAEKQLQFASSTATTNAFAHYNIGLIYLERKNYEKALTEAHLAYGLGFLQPELRDQLKRRGKWKEPVETTTNTPTDPDHSVH